MFSEKAFLRAFKKVNECRVVEAEEVVETEVQAVGGNQTKAAQPVQMTEQAYVAAILAQMKALIARQKETKASKQ